LCLLVNKTKKTTTENISTEHDGEGRYTHIYLLERTDHKYNKKLTDLKIKKKLTKKRWTKKFVYIFIIFIYTKWNKTKFLTTTAIRLCLQ